MKRSVFESTTSIVVVSPPPGIDEKTNKPVLLPAAPRAVLASWLACRCSSSDLNGELLGLELQQHALAGLRALAGDLAGDFFFADVDAERAGLPRAAVLDFQRGQALEHFQDRVALGALHGRAVVPHAVDLVAHADALRRVVEHDVRGPLLQRVVEQLAGRHTAGRLPRREQVDVVVAIRGAAHAA